MKNFITILILLVLCSACDLCVSNRRSYMYRCLEFNTTTECLTRVDAIYPQCVKSLKDGGIK